MTNFDFAELLGKMDDDILLRADRSAERQKRKQGARWHRWAALAASLAFAVMLGLHFAYPHLISDEAPPAVNSPQNPLPETDITVESAIRVNGKLYLPEHELSRSAEAENVGHLVGCLRLAGRPIWMVTPVFAYLPQEEDADRVILKLDGSYRVYVYSGEDE